MTCYRNGSDTIVLSALDIFLYFKYYSIIHKKNINKQLFVPLRSQGHDFQRYKSWYLLCVQ